MFVTSPTALPYPTEKRTNYICQSIDIKMTIRTAHARDLYAIVQLLAQDKLGKNRESASESVNPAYIAAYEQIAKDPNQELVVGVSDTNEVIGTLQISYIQYLTYKGGLRGQIEAVRIKASFRGQKLGAQLVKWAIDRCEQKGAHLVQLTTDKRRPESITFYKKMGFQDTHEGMKLHIH